MVALLLFWEVYLQSLWGAKVFAHSPGLRKSVPPRTRPECLSINMKHQTHLALYIGQVLDGLPASPKQDQEESTRLKLQVLSKLNPQDPALGGRGSCGLGGAWRRRGALSGQEAQLG